MNCGFKNAKKGPQGKGKRSATCPLARFVLQNKVEPKHELKITQM